MKKSPRPFKNDIKKNTSRKKSTKKKKSKSVKKSNKILFKKSKRISRKKNKLYSKIKKIIYDGTKKCPKCSNFQEDDTDFCNRCIESGEEVTMKPLSHDQELEYVSELSMKGDDIPSHKKQKIDDKKKNPDELSKKGDDLPYRNKDEDNKYAFGFLNPFNYLPSFNYLPEERVLETDIGFTDPSFTFYKKADYIKELSEKKLREFWSRGDGFCALHSIMQSYLINGNSFLHDDKGEVINDIHLLRVYLLKILTEYIHKYTQPEHIFVLYKQLEDDKTRVIESEFIFTLMSSLLNSKITVYHTNPSSEDVTKTVFTPNQNIFGKQDTKGEIFVTTNNIHYNSLIPENTNLDEDKYENTRTWRSNMMTNGVGVRLDDDFIKERMVFFWNIE